MVVHGGCPGQRLFPAYSVEKLDGLEVFLGLEFDEGTLLDSMIFLVGEFVSRGNHSHARSAVESIYLKCAAAVAYAVRPPFGNLFWPQTIW